MAVQINQRLTGFTGKPTTILAPTFLKVGKDAAGRPILRQHNLEFEIGRPERLINPPLISCLMVTANRPRMARIAIECYRRQTWPQKELVVVDSGTNDQLDAWIKTLGDASIRVVRLPGCTDRLGDLRNLSVEKAAGDLVCLWDDDDLQHPCRIEAAMAAMAMTRTRACLLFREVFWLVSARRFALTGLRPNENALLADKRLLEPYPSLAKLEDVPVIEALMETTPVALLDLPELYVYIAHGANTWDDEHVNVIWNQAILQFGPTEYGTVFDELSRCYPLKAYLKAVRWTAAKQQS